MILRSVALQNFRRFEALEMDFHPELTVVVARNGQGKTTVLEAVAAALGPFVGAFDHGRATNIATSDARYIVVGELGENEQMFPVSITASIAETRNSPEFSWSRALNSGRKGARTTTKEAAPLANLGKSLQDRLRTDSGVELPVIAYYSSKRLWVAHKNTQKKGLISSSRTMGYEDCLSSASSFRQMSAWLGEATFAYLQQKTFRGYSPEILEQRLLGIARAVNDVMLDEGWGEFHFSRTLGSPAMSHPDHGMLPLTLLSDGIRAMVSLVADLAFRCVRLNGHLGAKAPAVSAGIVLIDEVDLHLHPAWQQRVVQSLRRAFPKIQFIISTHSPQVVSTIDSESIRIIQHANDFDETGMFEVITPDEQMEGVSSAMALNEIFGVNPEPETKWSQKRSDYLAFIQGGAGTEEGAAEVLAQLVEHFGVEHPWILELNSIRSAYDLKLRVAQRRKLQDEGKMLGDGDA